MATKEDQEILRNLVQHVARAFYEPKYIIILDQLSRHPVLKDDELANRMGLQPKELNKVIAGLATDQLIKIYRQNELKEGAQRAVGRQYYYIDYEHFCNVVKWRIAKMRHKIDSTLRNELDNKGYICLQCKTSYQALDVDKLMDFTQGILVCEICRAEVVDNENAESVLGSKDRMQRFNHQMRFIRAGLQKSEGMVLPHFDVAGWVHSNHTEAFSAKAAAASSAPGGDLKIAGSGGTKTEDAGVGVLISTDKDEATRILERNAEAEMKRQQNALPTWHLKSTITGELTTLGLKEKEREETAQQQQLQLEMQQKQAADDALKGLGIVGQSNSTTMRMQSTPQVMVAPEEVKPVINQEADYYDQYYASLAASASASAAISTTATPAAMSYAIPDFSDTLEDDDMEDRKPNVQYLDSLGDYRKRSRSVEDEGKREKDKKVKMESAQANGINGHIMNSLNGHSIGSPPPTINGSGEMHGADAAMLVEEAATTATDDPIVHVNGKPVPFSQVTEEDQEMMTPDEYTHYYEVMTAREV